MRSRCSCFGQRSPPRWMPCLLPEAGAAPLVLLVRRVELGIDDRRPVVVVGGEDAARPQDARRLRERRLGLHPVQRLRARHDVGAAVVEAGLLRERLAVLDARRGAARPRASRRSARRRSRARRRPTTRASRARCRSRGRRRAPAARRARTGRGRRAARAAAAAGSGRSGTRIPRGRSPTRRSGRVRTRQRG